MKKKGSCRLDPKRALAAAEKIRIWQRRGVEKRMSRAKLAAEIGISPKQLRTLLINPSKRMRVAAERVAVEADTKKTAKIFKKADAFTFPKNKSAKKVMKLSLIHI